MSDIEEKVKAIRSRNDRHKQDSDIDTLISIIESQQQLIDQQAEEIEKLKIDSLGWQDEYMSLMRRHNELEKSALETLDLLKESSKQVKQQAKDIARLSQWMNVHERESMNYQSELIKERNEAEIQNGIAELAVKALERIQTYPRGEALVYVAEIKSIAEVALEEIKRISAEGEQPNE